MAQDGVQVANATGPRRAEVLYCESGDLGHYGVLCARIDGAVS